MNRRKILVVDDDPDIVELIDETFSAKNYTVLKTDNGYSAISKARNEHPDIIILDLMLPRLDGYQTCKKLKEFSETKNIPVLIISAHTNKEMLLKLLALGIKNYLAKPFDINELIKRVNILYRNSKKNIKIESNLKISIKKISGDIMTFILRGEFERADTSWLINELENRLIQDTKKIIINIDELKTVGIDHIKYLKEIHQYFSQKDIRVKISLSDLKGLRANLIKNSEIRDLLIGYY